MKHTKHTEPFEYDRYQPQPFFNDWVDVVMVGTVACLTAWVLVQHIIGPDVFIHFIADLWSKTM